MMQKKLSENLENWEYISRYSDWMYRSYSQWIGKKIFDVGAGMGRLVSYYLPSAERAVATDIFQDQVDHMNKKFCMYSAFTAKKLNILEDELTEFEGQFDTVLCINVLEHLSDDRTAIRKMYSLLEPGGNLIIMVPAFQNLYCQMDANVSHYRRYDRNVLRKMADDLGYVISHDGYFNMLGILPYFIKGKRKQGTEESFSSDLNEKNSKIYNFASKLLEPLEKICPPPLGLSEIFVIKRN